MKEELIKGRDIILFGFQPWETETGSNFIDIAHELSRFNRVLYVNRVLNRATLLNLRREPDVRTRQQEIERISETLWVLNPATVLESINWITFAWLHDRLNYINNRRLSSEINKAIEILGFRKVILINDNDFIRGRFLQELVPCEAYIFYLRDYLLGVPYFQRHGARLEAETFRQSTLVVSNTAYLAAYARQWNPDSFDIGQGFYLQPVQDGRIPDDIRDLPKPIIGYTGYISALRVDAAILAAIAKAFPESSIVLIGQTDQYNLPPGIADTPNIHFLGRKPLTEIPLYVQCFDICINPQLLNAITNGNYPRKVDEYLSMGKPVVVTRTEAMTMFREVTLQCTGPEEFVAAIREILRHPDAFTSKEAAEKRVRFVAGHTWTRSMARLYNAYAIVKRKHQLIPKQETTISKTEQLIRGLTICGIVAYLVFVYIKFMFF